jgi:hypothetical protein
MKIYILNGYHVEIHKDDYEHGEGECVNYYNEHFSQVFESKSDLIQFINENITRTDYNEDNFNCDSENNQITTDRLSSYDEYWGYSYRNNDDLELWKKGEKTLYNCRFIINVMAAIPTEF